MKKIFYICTKPIKNWDIFTPHESKSPTNNTKFSILLLHEDQDLQNISASHVWNLNQEESNLLDSMPIKSISYQDFLEQIFVHDLSMVI